MPSSTSVTKGIRGDFGWMFQLLSAVMSALAIVALARHAFVTWSLSAPMALVMDAYNAVMQLLFGWAHPYLQAVLTWLGSWIGWQPTLHPHWRDVFVVMALFVGGFSKGALHVGNERWWLVANLGTFGSLVGAVVVGVIVPQSANVWMVITPISIVLMAVTAAQRGVREGVMLGMAGLALGTSCASAALAYYRQFEVEFPGLAVLALLIVGIALSCVIMGLFARYRAPDDVEGRQLLPAGLTILVGFIGAFCFFAIDAGLKLLME